MAIAQRALDADRCLELHTAVTIFGNSILQDNAPGQTFASDLLQYLLAGQEASTFLKQPKYEHWRELNIEGLLGEEDIAKLSAEPITAVPGLLSPVINIAPTEIRATEVEANTDGPKNKLIAKYGSVESLFGNKELWVKGPNESASYVQVCDVAALLVGEDWNTQTINKAQTCLKQTLLTRWLKDNMADSPLSSVIQKVEGQPRKPYIAENNLVNFLDYLDQGFESKRNVGPHSISPDTITLWPSEAAGRKKKVRS